MPLVHTNPFHDMEIPALFSLFHRPSSGRSRRPTSGSKPSGSRNLFHMFKLLPMLTNGCKMVTLLSGRPCKPLLIDKATTGTLFGHRRGRLILTIQEDPYRLPIFVIELPILTTTIHKEMASDALRIALETENRTNRKKLLEEFVWAVYCNGRKVGHSIRRVSMGDDEAHVMHMLRGVSMGAGVLPGPEKDQGPDGEMTYVRARFDRVVGSKDSESFYMISPDGTSGQELSIFFLRIR